MDEQTIGQAPQMQQAVQMQENVFKLSMPLQTAWRNAFFDLPLTVYADTMRFIGQRMQAHGDFFASLRSCHTVPEVIEAQSSFVRTAVDQYGAETSKIMGDVRASMSKAA